MLSNKEIYLKQKFIANNTIKCECGHSMFFKRDNMICSWCGRRVFKDDRAKFKYELNRKIKKLERKMNNDF